MQFFKRIIRLALHNHYIKDDPFLNYEIKLQDVYRGYLAMDELKLIINKDFEIQRLDFVRDLFIFSSFTGLTYGDLKDLQRKHFLCSMENYGYESTDAKQINHQQ